MRVALVQSPRMRKWWASVRPKLIGSLVWAGARLVGKTLRYRLEGMDNYERAAKEGGVVLVTWHGRTFVPANYFAGQGWWAIISLSNDGNIQNRIFTLFGYKTVRGSTGRGGVRAALEAAKRVKEGGKLALTPDGPRGPQGFFGEGTLLIAQKAGRPVIPVGIAAHPRTLIPTWDRYMLPWPFAKAAIVMGEPMAVPEDITDEQSTAIGKQLAAEIDRLQMRAETLAGG